MQKYYIFVINPGGGSSKIAYFVNNELIKRETLRHPPHELLSYSRTIDQLSYRYRAIKKAVEEWNIKELNAVVGRGGPFKPLKSGTYRVNDIMINDILKGRVLADHPSNLGALLAQRLANTFNTNAYIVDPVSVDEFIPESRISGMPELERKSLSHALNMKMVMKLYAEKQKTDITKLNLIVVHLGTGISIGAMRKGQQIDVNNANDGGPFSPQRTGSLPVTQLVKLCFSGRFSKEEMLNKITRQGGFLAYLGTDMLSDVEKMVNKGDKQAEIVYNAMIIQIAKEIGAMAAVLEGDVDAILITGGMAHFPDFVANIKKKVSFITNQFFEYPGEHELEALAFGAYRVLIGKEEVKTYE